MPGWVDRGHCRPLGPGHPWRSVGRCPLALLAAEWGGHLGRLRVGWDRGTHGGSALAAGAYWCIGPQSCGAMGRWGPRAVGLMGCRETGWGAGGVRGVQCGWVGMGQGWLGCRSPVPVVWLDATWHCGWQGIAVTPSLVPVSPAAGSHGQAALGAATGQSAPWVPVPRCCWLPVSLGSGHLPIWGGQLGWHGGKRRLVTMVLAALPPRPLRCQPGCRLPPCSQALLQPQQEPPAPPQPTGACTWAPAARRRGRLCHMEPGAPGTAGACVRAGAGTCAPWPWGSPRHPPHAGAAGWACVPCMPEPELPGATRSPQPGTTLPVTPHSRVPDSQVMEDGAAPPSIPACAAPGPAAGTGRVTRAGCVALARSQPSPGARVPGSAGCRASAPCQGRAGWREARAKAAGRGDEDTAATWPCGGSGAAPGGAGTPGSPPVARGTGQPCRVSPPWGSGWSRRFTERH